MKRCLFSLFILCALDVACQSSAVEHVKIKQSSVSKDVNFFPHIGPYFDGEIPIFDLEDPAGIQAADGWKVISFSISYPFGNLNKIVPVKGNVIPVEIIRDIYANCLGEMIFITNIVCLNKDNVAAHLVAMTLIPVR